MERARKRRQIGERGKAMERKTVRISVEVRSGTARFRVGVQAENIRKALSMVGGRYPNGVVRAVFAAELRGYLDGKPAAGATERTHALAA